MKTFLICIGVLFSFTTSGQSVVPNISGDSGDEHVAFKRNATLGRGMNFGNALEAPNEGEWGLVIKESYVQAIADAGFNSVRLPVCWSAHTSSSAPYVIDIAFLNRVDTIVNWCLRRNLAVIITIHHFNDLYSHPGEPAFQNKFLLIWRQLSLHYKDYQHEKLFFEVLNEPHDNLTADKWNELIPMVIDTVRKTDTERTLIIDVPDYAYHGSIDKLVIPENETNTIVSVRYYLPYPFTHQGAHWADGSEAWLGTTWTATKDQKNTVEADMKTVQSWAQKHQRPVTIGEFGPIIYADSASRLIWTDFVTRSFETQGFSWSYFDFGVFFMAYDTNLNDWLPGFREALIHDGDGADSVANILRGRWYQTYSCNKSDECDSLTPVSGDSVIIEPLSGSNYIIWKTYHNCLTDSSMMYRIVFDSSSVKQKKTWMLVHDSSRYVIDYISDKEISIIRDVPGSGYFNITRIDTFTFDPAPVITYAEDSYWSWRCGPGSVKLNARSNVGTVHWYAEPAGGNAIGTGDVFITPILDTTTCFFVDATSNGCVTPTRMVITARIEDCGSEADSLALTIDGRWYCIRRSGGYPGGSENLWPVPGDSVIIKRIPGKDSITWRAYHQCKLKTDAGYAIQYGDKFSGDKGWLLTSFGAAKYDFSKWKLPDGVEWLAIGEQYYDGYAYIYTKIDTFTNLNETPVIISTAGGARCGPGEVILGAMANPGIINWYTDSTGGNAVATGTSFMTPFIETSTVYYAEAAEGGCTTSRVPVPAVISDSDTCAVSSKSHDPASFICLHPNPTSGEITIHISRDFDERISLDLVDSKGCFIKSLGPVRAEISTDLSAYPSGMYFIKIKSSEGIQWLKVLKQ